MGQLAIGCKINKLIVECAPIAESSCELFSFLFVFLSLYFLRAGRLSLALAVLLPSRCHHLCLVTVMSWGFSFSLDVAEGIILKVSDVSLFTGQRLRCRWR